MNAGVFNTNQNLQVKRKFVNDAKIESPRKIEILMLKNRYGQGYSRYFFDYYAAHDLFIPYERKAEEVDEEMSSKFEEYESRLESASTGKRKPKRTK